MAESGLEAAETREAQHMPVDMPLREVRAGRYLEKGWILQLALLTDAEHAAGLARIEAAGEEARARGEDSSS